MQRFAFIVTVVVCALLFASNEASAQVLTKSGSCPGSMQFQVTGATPFARLAFIHSPNTGSWMIPGGIICGTTVTGLSAPVTFGGFVTANAAGNKTVNVNVPANLCNRWLQVIDTSTCNLTNVVQIN